MHHIIYRTTNQLNGRFYIGKHSTENVDDGYLGSGRRIKAEVKKYGRENFDREILERLPCTKSLSARERELVNEELLQDPLCLNLKNGGEGGKHGREAEVWARPGYRERVGASLSTTLQSQHEILSERAKALNMADRLQTGKSTRFAGKKHSEETKQKMRAAHAKRTHQ